MAGVKQMDQSILSIGPYQAYAIETGVFALDGGAMFGVVPKTLWSCEHPADTQNRITLALRVLLLYQPAQGTTPRRLILIDCGIGSLWPEKQKGIFKIDHSRHSLDGSLAKIGFSRDQVTDLILTHLHFDHAGGLLMPQDPARPDAGSMASFPHARVFLQRKNWEHAWKPSERERASYRPELFSLYKDEPACARRLTLLDTSQEEEILPGISVFRSDGHTTGMQLVRVSDEKNTLYYCADMIPTSTHVKLPFVMAYDCRPLDLLEEKRATLKRAVDENAWIFFEHCPKTPRSHVRVDAKGGFEAEMDGPPALGIA